MLRSHDRWVIDASVAAKWYLRDEPLTVQADLLWGQIEDGAIAAAAPHVSRHEVASLLATACWRGRIERARALSEHANYVAMGLSMDSDPEWLLSDATEMAIDLRVALYDSVYLALARRLNMQFVTMDDKLIRALGDKLPFVHWLGDL